MSEEIEADFIRCLQETKTKFESNFNTRDFGTIGELLSEMQIFLRLSDSVNPKEMDVMSPAYVAESRGSVKVLQTLKEMGVDFDKGPHFQRIDIEQNENGESVRKVRAEMSLFQKSAADGNVEVFTFLLKHADFTKHAGAVDYDINTPVTNLTPDEKTYPCIASRTSVIYEAAKLGHAAIINALANDGINIEKDPGCQTYYALVQNGKPLPSSIRSARFEAAEKGHTEFFKALDKIGLPIDEDTGHRLYDDFEQQKLEHPSLIAAIQANNKDIVSHILTHRSQAKLDLDDYVQREPNGQQNKDGSQTLVPAKRFHPADVAKSFATNEIEALVLTKRPRPAADA